MIREEKEMEKYVLVESWSAHDLEEMEMSICTIEDAKWILEDFWENDDEWEETFDSQEEFDEHMERIRNCTKWEELESMLDGIGYWLFTEKGYKEALEE